MKGVAEAGFSITSIFLRTRHDHQQDHAIYGLTQNHWRTLVLRTPTELLSGLLCRTIPVPDPYSCKIDL